MSSILVFKNLISGVKYVGNEITASVLTMSNFISLEDIKNITLSKKYSSSHNREFMSGHIICKWNYELRGRPLLVERTYLHPIQIISKILIVN